MVNLFFIGHTIIWLVNFDYMGTLNTNDFHIYFSFVSILLKREECKEQTINSEHLYLDGCDEVVIFRRKSPVRIRTEQTYSIAILYEYD